MHKFGLFFMIVAMLALPMLACGFPLPVGTSTAPAAKIVCAANEPVDSCQARQDAYELMNNLQSVVIPDLSVVMNSAIPDSEGQIVINGSMTYQVTGADTPLGADLHVTLDEANIDMTDETDSAANLELIVSGDRAYATTPTGGWEYRPVDEELMTLLGLMFGLAGPAGSQVDLYGNPDTFTVTQGEAVTIDDQPMLVQTLSLNLSELLLSPETVTSMMEGLFALGGDTLGLSEETFGMPLDEFATMAGMLLPFLEGTDAVTTLYIGAEDGYIHYIEAVYSFSMDMTAVDPNQPAMSASYTLSGHLTDHNQPQTITAPENAQPAEGDLFEGSGLGEGIFGN